MTPSVPTFEPFPVHALPRCLRPFVEAVAAATGTDTAFAALSVLVVAAGCIRNRVAVILRSGWIEPAVLWGALVGRSGVTKSPVIKAVVRALFELYKVERYAFAEAIRALTTDEITRLLRIARWRPLAEYGREVVGGDSAGQTVTEREVVRREATRRAGVAKTARRAPPVQTCPPLSAHVNGGHIKRVMGLEPTTFTLAT